MFPILFQLPLSELLTVNAPMNIIRMDIFCGASILVGYIIYIVRLENIKSKHHRIQITLFLFPIVG